MNYTELVDYLDRNWTKNPAVAPIDDYPFGELRDLLARRGDPQRGLHVIHVTGTKGKGSVAAFAHSVLESHGLAAGAFISPHLVRIEERIVGPRGPIDGQELAFRMTELITLAAELGHDPRSLWRLLLVAALEHFRDQGTRCAVIEVGVGGRYDPTNVLDGAVACVTPVGLEHVPRLGYTLADIAAQKIGILKPGRTCVAGPQTNEVDAVLRAGVALAGGRLVRVLVKNEGAGDESDIGPPGDGAVDGEPQTSVARVVVRALDGEGVIADLATPHRAFPDTRISLLGRHQAENAALALSAVEELFATCGLLPGLNDSAVRLALANAEWPARLELLQRGPLLVYDGAHTAESTAVLVAALRAHFPEVRWCFVVGSLTRRDTSGMLRSLAPVADRLIAVPVRGFDALSADDVAALARAAGVPSETAPSVAAALARSGETPICITGTLYLYAETLASLAPRMPRR